MLMVRGLGQSWTTGQTQPAGYCFDGGVWRWSTAAGCPNPLVPGGPPLEQPGFCWTRDNPPADFPGHWSRGAAGQPCPQPGPPSPPNVPAGFCKNPTTGRWEWVLASQCAEPVQPGVPTDRDHTAGETPGVYDVGDQLNPASGTQMTYPMVTRLYKNTWKAYQERERALVKAWAQGLTPCPPGSRLPNLPGCYTHGPRTMAQTIPGTFELFGVPFNIAEPGVLKSPRFERLYTPNNEQRILIEGAIIERSHKLFETMTAGATYKYSVKKTLERLPRWKMTVPGMAIRAPLPRTDELEADGGFEKWLKRGGFLIALDVTEGKTRLNSEPWCPVACAGNVCLCDAHPACMGAGVPSTDAVASGCFWWYAQVQPTGQMRLVGQHDDPSWFDRVAAKLEAFGTAFGNFICSSQPLIQAQTQSAVAEKCLDKNGKPCTKGAAGCTCVSPSAATQGGVGIFNFIAGKMCQGWIGEQQNPVDAMPPVPDPPKVEITPAWMRFVPWILGGLAAGAGGAFVLARR